MTLDPARKNSRWSCFTVKRKKQLVNKIGLQLMRVPLVPRMRKTFLSYNRWKHLSLLTKKGVISDKNVLYRIKDAMLHKPAFGSSMTASGVQGPALT